MVRINLSLKSLNSCSQKIFDKKFRSSFKGFIYKLLENSKFGLDKENSYFRGFCFSNIFPIRDSKLEENKVYHINISSIYSDLIMIILSKINIGDKINLGEGSFEIIDMKIEREDIFENILLESMNPICIKTNKNDSELFVNYDKNKKLFIKNLAINLIKKYNFYYNENVDLDFNLFENIDIESIINKRKNTSHYSLIMEDFDINRKGKPIYVYGNKLRFKIGEINGIQKKILQTGLESGFGSMNSYGMGYMRLMK